MATVSVWITTYNHEKFIAQAIESVLAQILNHKLEIVIAEDCSSDRTREIVLDYKNNYPDTIKLCLSPHNLGCNPIFFATYHQCSGDYIAWLDGDDYWSCPYKLQSQIDILESNPDIVFCFHKVIIDDVINQQTRESYCPPLVENSALSFEDFISKEINIYAPSVVHKNILNQGLPSWFYSLPIVDLGFYYILLDKGKGYYINKNMAVYRVHNNGSWSGASIYNKNYQYGEFYKIFKSLKPQLKDYFERKICFHFSLLLELELLSRNFTKAFYYFGIIKDNGFKGFNMRKLWIIKLIIKFVLIPFRNKKISYT